MTLRSGELEIDSGHLSPITHPREVTQLILLSATQAASHYASGPT
jgi:hypothetical protein